MYFINTNSFSEVQNELPTTPKKSLKNAEPTTAAAVKTKSSLNQYDWRRDIFR